MTGIECLFTLALSKANFYKAPDKIGNSEAAIHPIRRFWKDLPQ
ncbi:hypothetical protein [Kovacikia minuta]|nr:hypothetical protein [Kovacikia minuta]